MIAVTALSPTAALAAPANDDFASAQTVGPVLPVDVFGTTEAATGQGGEPTHGNFSNPRLSVWYRWTAPSDVEATVDVCGSLASPAVAVYTGSTVNGLTPVAPNTGRCVQRFSALADTTYTIAVDGGGFVGGTGFYLDVHEFDPPPNDNFADRQDMSPLPIAVAGTNVDSSTEPLEVDSFSVWYEWSPLADGRFVLDVCGAGHRATVWTGEAIGALTGVPKIRPDGCRFRFDATAGIDYKISINTFGAPVILAPFTLLIRPLTPPANDAFGSPQPLVLPLPLNLPGTTVDASAEPGEPGHYGWSPSAPPATSVWYGWAPPAPVDAIVDVCPAGSTEPPTAVARVYTGNTLEGLVPVGQQTWECRVRFPASAGVPYRIAVDSREFSSEQPFGLRLRHANPPPNDDFAQAERIDPTLPLRLTGSALDADSEPGEPAHGPGPAGGPSVWYEWTPTADAHPRGNACYEGSLTAVAVYAGDSLGALTPIAKNGNFCELAFAARAGTSYKIAVIAGEEFSFEFADASVQPTSDQNVPQPGPGISSPCSTLVASAARRCKALEKCRQLKGRKRARCSKRARSIGRKKPRR